MENWVLKQLVIHFKRIIGLPLTLEESKMEQAYRNSVKGAKSDLEEKDLDELVAVQNAQLSSEEYFEKYIYVLVVCSCIAVADLPFSLDRNNQCCRQQIPRPVNSCRRAGTPPGYFAV
jgi:hypothetical protein